jgi:phage shock protein A
MNADIVNVYIEKLLNEIVELTKNRILLLTQLQVAEQTVESLRKELESLEARLNKKATKQQKDEAFD